MGSQVPGTWTAAPVDDRRFLIPFEAPRPVSERMVARDQQGDVERTSGGVGLPRIRGRSGGEFRCGQPGNTVPRMSPLETLQLWFARFAEDPGSARDLWSDGTRLH